MVFTCNECGKQYDYDKLIWKCDCGGYLKLVYDVVFKKEDIIKERLNLWRYDKAYPIKYEDVSISFDEGLTPFVKISWDDMDVRVKMESLMPSCSFKDRGTVMAVNYLKNHGVTYITEDSSGNAAASVSAYCALGGIECEVFVPAGNSSGKIMQAAAYGAKINAVEGTREDVANAAQVHAESYAGHNWHPMFAVGTKSCAYEIWEQNGFESPKIIITPCGGGSLTLGLIQGFKELYDNGEVEAMPKIYAVQPENCNPIYRMFHNITDEFVPKITIAEGTSIAKPVKGKEIVEGIRFTGGSLVTVNDDQTKAALKKACTKGVYIEPTSAIAFAALTKLREEGVLNAKSQVVVIASGNGLKAGEKIKEILF